MVNVFSHYKKKKKKLQVPAPVARVQGISVRLSKPGMTWNLLGSEPPKPQTFSGWWFQLLWKIWKSVGSIIPNIWKNKKMFQTTKQFCSSTLRIQIWVPKTSAVPSRLWSPHRHGPGPTRKRCQWISLKVFFFQGNHGFPYGYGSIPINTIFRGMNIHLPAILMFTRGTRFWHTAICFHHQKRKIAWVFLPGFPWSKSRKVELAMSWASELEDAIV